MVNPIENFLSLVITFTTLGLGYSAIYLGYWIAGSLGEFKEHVSGTDKVMQSFVIGTIVLLYSLFFTDISSLSPMTLSKFGLLMPDYAFVWVASMLTISVILLNHKN